MKVLKYFAFNGIWLILVIEGVMRGNEYAFNVVAFFSWVIFVLSFVVAANAEAQVKTVEGGTIGRFGSIPLWFDAAYDIILVSIFASYGHYEYAAIWFWSMMILQGVHQNYPKAKVKYEAMQRAKAGENNE